MATKNAKVTNLDELTPSQQEKVRDIKASGGQAEVTKCRFCGKILVRDASIEQEAGDLCEKLHQSMTNEDLMAHRGTMTATAVPEGYIKVADLHKICEANGIPVNRMVNAIGRDRALKSAIDPRFAPVYVGRTRYVSGFCATKDGLAMIRGIKPTKDEQAKAEVAELADAVA